MNAYKILIVDDDLSIHSITKLILQNFDFEGTQIEMHHAYSGEEAKRFLLEHSDTAVVLLDVVMETTHSGLEVVEYLRKSLSNFRTRVILRTGQPGEAPEETIIRDYDINDYRLKTDMTAKRLYTSLYAALRSYRDIVKIDANRMGLEKIIATSGSLFRHSTLQDFLNAILNHLSQFVIQTHSESDDIKSDGMVIASQNSSFNIVSATGTYKTFQGKTLEDLPNHTAIKAAIMESIQLDVPFFHMDDGFLLRNRTIEQHEYYIFIANQTAPFNFDLIQLFLANYTVALDNYILSGLINTTQKELIITLGEVVENHFDETSGHVKRISEYIRRFSLTLGLSSSTAEMYSIASTMHDIGKIAMPDAILKKPGRLTPEEFETIKQHPIIGHSILSKSNLEVLKASAEIAYYHHEKYDGTGYPCGLKEDQIPISARMLAILDVFDAMTHKRVYKSASPRAEAMDYLMAERGKHFDPLLVDAFLKEIDTIIQ